MLPMAGNVEGKAGAIEHGGYTPALHEPRPPRSIEETDLPVQFLVELALKTFFQGGYLRLWDLTERLKLPVAVIEQLLEFLRAEQLCETGRRGAAETEIGYRLTDSGRERANTALKKSQYVGPAPVSLTAYVNQVQRQSIRGMGVTRDGLTRTFEGIVIRPSLLEQLGAALNSGRSVFLYGPSGAGKTFIAEHMAGVLSGHVYVPHAIEVDGEVIRVFDPLVHQPAQKASGEAAARRQMLDQRHPRDERWVRCRRPVVVTGGELTLAMLDLQFDTNTRFYVAPPQVKANNGLLVVDDLGRQLVAARDLMNRWIVPLDRRIDHLAMHTGKKFRIPFDVTVVFSTNLRPADLADDAFLRRLGYKIHVGALDEAEYGTLFRQVCERMGVPWSQNAFEHVVHERHARESRPLLACIPADLVGQVRDRAIYEGWQPELTPEMLDWAWQNYFAV